MYCVSESKKTIIENNILINFWRDFYGKSI